MVNKLLLLVIPTTMKPTIIVNNTITLTMRQIFWSTSGTCSCIDGSNVNLGTVLEPYVKDSRALSIRTQAELSKMVEVISQKFTRVSLYASDDPNSIDSQILLEIAKANSRKSEAPKMHVIAALQDSYELHFETNLYNLMNKIIGSNKLYPKTVTGVVVTTCNFDEFEDLRKFDLINLESWMTRNIWLNIYQFSLKSPSVIKAFTQLLFQWRKISTMIETTKQYSVMKDLEVGLRSDSCLDMIGDFALVAKAAQFIEGHEHSGLDEIWTGLDFVICRQLPPVSSTPIESAHSLIGEMNHLLKNYNERWPKLKLIFETGWPTVGKATNGVEGNVSSMNEFWCEIDQWSKENSVQVDFFTAFDRPSVSDKVHEANYGWWIRAGEEQDGLPNFVEKINYTPSGAVNQETDTSSIVMVIVVSGCIGITAIVITLTYFKVKFTMNRFLTKEELIDFKTGLKKGDGEGECEFSLPYDSTYEISENTIHIDESQLLGKGTFGLVFRGTLDGNERSVAFKIPQPNCKAANFKSLLSEIKILAHVGNHNNVVSIIGAYTEEIHRGRVIIALELCENGSLEKFLKLQKLNLEEHAQSENRNDCVINEINKKNWEELLEKLLVLAYEISSGMEHIAWKNIIHADLAARNVLLTANGTAKVTDFGLAKHTYENQDSVKKNMEPIPWRWMALESLEDQSFSTKSDVWSFGVTLYEVFSLGDIPYKGLTWNQNFTKLLREGLQLETPLWASPGLNEIMRSCLLFDPEQRPTFTELKVSLQNMCPSLEKNAYLSIIGEN